MTTTPDLHANSAIPGYTRGMEGSSRSPMSDADFGLLKATVLFNDEDSQWLHMANEVLSDQIEDVLDVWYGFVASMPHLVSYFAGEDGAPSKDYLNAVRKRFGAWILDTTAADYDRTWLDYQYEIGLRHTRARKNGTDHVTSTSPVVNLRYMIAFIVPLTVTMKPFLAKKGHTPQEVDGMHQAWLKALTLTAALWAQPYIASEDF